MGEKMVEFVEEWGPGYRRYSIDGVPVFLSNTIEEAIRQRDELRALLAPLLDNAGCPPNDQEFCVFCGVVACHGGDHKPDCPVLRRDELLGRD